MIRSDRNELPLQEQIEYGDDPDLLRAVLRPYRDNCRYLKRTAVTWCGEPSQKGRVSVRGDFEIAESCYIDDTGHFNAVEFNICFNQMIYYIMAKAVKERVMLPFGAWNMADYWTRQLPDMFIVDYHSAFRRAMRGRRFTGELQVVRILERNGGNGPLVILDTVCRYWEDDGGGACDGEVKLAIKNPPRREA